MDELVQQSVSNPEQISEDQSIDNTEYNGKCHCEHYCELNDVRCVKARIKKIKL